MRVFVTGASGFIGSAVVRELLSAGHAVVGLARSDAAAAALTAAGAGVLRGDLEDLEGLRRGAADADGVIHCAFIHDFVDIAAAGRTDLQAVETFAAALAGSDRPLVVTSGTAVFGAGVRADEDTIPGPGSPGKHRIASEDATRASAARGVRGCVIRLPPSVHGAGDHGFVPMLVRIARERGAAAFVGDGANRWAAVHRLDAARLYRLVLERGVAGASYHGVAEEGVPTREIAAVIGRRLGVPVVGISREEVPGHFGWLGNFFAADCAATSASTRARLEWTPEGPGLLADLDSAAYWG